MQKLSIVLVLTLLLARCTTCTNCTPFAEEPFVKLRFYNATDSSVNIVIIDSINHVWAGTYAYYQDTVNTYKLPLNMNTDSSFFEIWFRDTAMTALPVKNFLQVNYTRNFTKQTDNNIRVQCDITYTKSDFAQSSLQCAKSSTENCSSNEALFQVYR